MLDSKAREIWILYSVGTAVTMFRLYSRSKVLGVRGLQPDDYLAILAILFWTAMCYTDYTIRVLSNDLSSTLMAELYSDKPIVREDLLEKVPQSQIDLVEKVMKLNFASWMLKPPMVWSLKGCMVVFFLRLTNNLPWMRKLTIFTTVVVVLTFIAAEGTTLLLCVPTKDNWDIFSKEWKYCSNSWSKRAQIVNLLTIGITNLVTDILLVIIPFPMLWQVRIPLKRKIITGFLLSSGIFIVIIIATRMSFGLMSYSATGQRASDLRSASFGWGMRENFTAVVVVNSIQIKPFFNTAQWKMLYSRITGSKISTAASSVPSERSTRRKVRDPWSTAATNMDGTSTQIKVETTLTIKSEGRETYMKEKGEDADSIGTETKVGSDDIV